MNKTLFSFLAIAFYGFSWLSSAIAREEPYKGQCLYINEQEEKQDFESCQVKIQQDTLMLNFEEEEHQEKNTTITGKSVKELASGEYATQLLSDSGGAVSGLLLGPVNMVGNIFAPDQDFQQYIIHYEDTNNKEAITIVNIDRSDAPEFQQELSLLTGKLITFRPGQENTTINIGPDVDDVVPGQE